ncbi:MAG: glycine zipper domain-containing protein [Lacipirellulaceae bacterium]
MAVDSKKVLLTFLVLSLFVSPTAAQQYYYQPNQGYYRNDTREGTIVGGGLGALTGALIGGSKNWEGGALIGAGVGALTGRAIGSAQDRADTQQVIVGNSIANQANAQAAATAVTNFDLTQMTAAGLSDDLIISTIQSRGGRFDLSPNGLISLKQSGVSDRVVLEAQRAAGRAVPTPINPRPVVQVVRPAPVYVRPAPVIHYYHGPRVYRHHYHRGW